MIFYYAFVIALLMLTGPFLLLANKRRAGIWQKLGFVPESIKEVLREKQRPLWLHAVSVGEFNAVWPLVVRLLEKYPQQEIVISVSTKAGYKLACERIKDKVSIIYFPLDLPWAIKNWLDVVKPIAVAIVETELWPGFTHECFLRQIPLVVVNGRISPKSFKSYYRFRAFFAQVVRRFQTIVVQSESDAQRYQAIAGNYALNIQVCGNLKFDGLQPISEDEKTALQAALGINNSDYVIVAGSTHEGEEETLLGILKKLSKKMPLAKSSTGKLRLILAPRHPERWQHVAALIEGHGFCVKRYSNSETITSDNDVYLLDVIGQLFNYYSLATVAFVGGTMVPIGGHNIVEPYAYGIPVICGRFLDKTRDAATALKQIKALTVVQNNIQLEEKLHEILRSDELRTTLGDRGKTWLRQNQGAVEKTLQILESSILTTYNKPVNNKAVKINARKS